MQSIVLPVEGVAKARDSSMYFRNDEQIRGIQRMFTELTNDPTFFRSVIFTCDTIQVGQDAQNVETLNWYIDPEEFDQIRHNMEPFQASRRHGKGRNRPRPQRYAGAESLALVVEPKGEVRRDSDSLASAILAGGRG